MKKVIIAGASGMVGSIIQKACLTSPDVTEVTSIVRRPSGINNPKLKELVHQDFLDFSEVKEYFEGQNVAYFCIGAYTGYLLNLRLNLNLDLHSHYTVLLMTLSR